jgi:Ras family
VPSLIRGAAAGSSPFPIPIHAHPLIHPPSQGYIPITSDYVTYLQFGNKIVQVAFWDTVSREEHARLRPLGYLNSHAILIAFSVGSPESFKNVQEKVRPSAPFSHPHPSPAAPFKFYMRLTRVGGSGVYLFLSVAGLPGDNSGGQR